jgi:hypothetical protein
MSGSTPDTFDLEVLEPDANRGYLPQPIPIARDSEITKLLLQIIDEHHWVLFTRHILDGHALVLRAFAERMASAAVRNRNPELLRVGLIALLLSWRGADLRETLTVCPLFCDAARRIGVDLAVVVASIRQMIGDEPAAPFIEFAKRSESSKSLQAMGYAAGADDEGFRYLRNW